MLLIVITEESKEMLKDVNEYVIHCEHFDGMHWPTKFYLFIFFFTKWFFFIFYRYLTTEYERLLLTQLSVMQIIISKIPFTRVT